MSALRLLHRITHWLLNWLNGIEIRYFRRLFDRRKIRSRRLWLRQLSGVPGSRLLELVRRRSVPVTPPRAAPCLPRLRNTRGATAFVQGMPQPLVVSVPHSLGKEEAVRRLKSGLATAQSQFRQFFTVQEEIWSGDRLAFRVATLGQTASGTLDVAEDHVRLEIVLPWLLSMAARQIQRVVNAQGTIMLEKK